MKCEYRVQPGELSQSMRVFVFLSLEVQWWLELLMGLIITKTYLYHWLSIFAQFWTQFYCSSTIKRFLSANEFKIESNLSRYMSKQGRSFPLGRAVPCVTKGAPVEGKHTSPPSLLQESLSPTKVHSFHCWLDIALTNRKLERSVYQTPAIVWGL